MFQLNIPDPPKVLFLRPSLACAVNFLQPPPPSYTLLVTSDLPLRPTRKPFYFPQNSLTYPPQVINNDLLPTPPKKNCVHPTTVFQAIFFSLERGCTYRRNLCF